MSKKMSAPQTNITMVKPKGITDQSTSSQIFPFDGFRAVIVTAAAIFDGEDENNQKNQRNEKNRHRDEKKEKRIHPCRHGGCLLRKQGKPQVHRFRCSPWAAICDFDPAGA